MSERLSILLPRHEVGPCYSKLTPKKMVITTFFYNEAYTSFVS